VLDAAGVVTFFEWGDVQTGTSSSKTIMIQHSQGSTAFWLLDGTVKTLSTNPALPPGVTLSWNLAAAYPVSNCPGAELSGITGCIQLQPGQVTGTLQLTMTASTSAAENNINFETIFNAYSTSTG